MYFANTLNINGLDGPTDVTYSSNMTSNSLNDDYLLIANKGAKNIVKSSLNGTVLNTFNQFKTGGVTYNFRSPIRVADIPGTSYMAIIDDVLNYLLVGRYDSQNPNVLLCHNVIKFNGSQHPKDVGVNCFGDILVPDNLNQIHKFTFIGEYICTYVHILQTRSNFLYVFPESMI